MEPRAIGAFLDDHKLTFKRDFPLFDYTTFRIGGHADFFVMPQNTRELALLQGFCRQNHVPVFILGGGSNILVSDAGFRGIVIHPDLGEEFRIVEQSASHLRVFVPASARAPLAGKRISALGFQGLEFLTTIPGHFGGSIIQNAGCYGHELTDSIVSVEAVIDAEPRILDKRECAFSYRNSLFKQNPAIWVSGATLEIPAGNAAEITARIDDYKARRIASQPKNRRSAGSIFKNPAKEVSEKKAWQLIDEAGLRGVKEGGCEISAEHCNFIVNNGGGKAADVHALASLIETKVFETTGIRLEREVVFVGEF
ncbi:MAG: UDP-N-acetylmuramate dehydrogenase [Turneriella sp.]|nr:UDP-N-acetylmuramate dehydrogenase [Turneriella sp.]